MQGNRYHTYWMHTLHTVQSTPCVSTSREGCVWLWHCNHTFQWYQICHTNYDLSIKWTTNQFLLVNCTGTSIFDSMHDCGFWLVAQCVCKQIVFRASACCVATTLPHRSHKCCKVGRRVLPHFEPIDLIHKIVLGIQIIHHKRLLRSKSEYITFSILCIHMYL